MVPGGVTEVVWHFAGYLQIINDIARDRIDYDQSAFRSVQDDYTTARPSYESRPDLDELDSRGLKVPEAAPVDELHHGRIFPIKSFGETLSQPDQDIEQPDALPRLFAPRGAGGGGGAGGDYKITVQYKESGEQTQLEIHQYNIMSDSDHLLVGVEGSELACDIAQLANHTVAALERIADNANDQIPEEWWMQQGGTGVTEFVKTFDENLVVRDGQPGTHSVEPGYFLNGTRQDPAPEPPYTTPAAEPEPAPDFGNHPGQWADAGSNISFNAALIVDLSESGRSMIVMGDYYKTNAIFQTNSTMDNDHVTVAGGNAQPAATGVNKSDNIADFVQNPGIYDSLPATFAGPQWNVHVAEGDYYNVHTIVQLNYLLDNDIIVQKSADSHYEVYSGGNELGNLAQVFDGSIHYDLIIVAGGYHGLNVIFQNNILLNNDQINMLANGADTAQTVASGQNELTNAATIESYGDDNFQPMDGDLNSLVTAIGDGLTVLAPVYGTYIDGSGGVFNVLYVKGDYYDINAIWQTNVTADVNVIIQILDTPLAAAMGLHQDDASAQWVTSGENKLSNDAVIVDVGATNTYVNGDVYGDTILVQANLLPDNDHAIVRDTNALVPELIAFVNESQEEQPEAPPVVCLTIHDDPITSVMN